MKKVGKLSIVIPVYNEEKTLLKILEKVWNVDLGDVEKEIVLVDDGSVDGSIGILENLQKTDPNLKVIFKRKNSGKGATLKVGFKHTTGDYVIVQDADLEYDPNDYLKLIKTLEDNDVDVVYGSRFSGNYEDMSSLHYFGNKFLTMVANLMFRVMLTDMETCYKLLPGDFVRDVEIKSARFNFEPEITAKVLKSGLRIREVPISYRGRSHNEGKHLTWRDGLSALLTLIRFRIFD